MVRVNVEEFDRLSEPEPVAPATRISNTGRGIVGDTEPVSTGPGRAPVLQMPEELGPMANAYSKAAQQARTIMEYPTITGQQTLGRRAREVMFDEEPVPTLGPTAPPASLGPMASAYEKYLANRNRVIEAFPIDLPFGMTERAIQSIQPPKKTPVDILREGGGGGFGSQFSRLGGLGEDIGTTIADYGKLAGGGTLALGALMGRDPEVAQSIWERPELAKPKSRAFEDYMAASGPIIPKIPVVGQPLANQLNKVPIVGPAVNDMFNPLNLLLFATTAGVGNAIQAGAGATAKVVASEALANLTAEAALYYADELGLTPEQKMLLATIVAIGGGSLPWVAPAAVRGIGRGIDTLTSAEARLAARAGLGSPELGQVTIPGRQFPEPERPRYLTEMGEGVPEGQPIIPYKRPAKYVPFEDANIGATRRPSFTETKSELADVLEQNRALRAGGQGESVAEEVIARNRALGFQDVQARLAAGEGILEARKGMEGRVVEGITPLSEQAVDDIAEFIAGRARLTGDTPRALQESDILVHLRNGHALEKAQIEKVRGWLMGELPEQFSEKETMAVIGPRQQEKGEIYEHTPDYRVGVDIARAGPKDVPKVTQAVSLARSSRVEFEKQVSADLKAMKDSLNSTYRSARDAIRARRSIGKTPLTADELARIEAERGVGSVQAERARVIADRAQAASDEALEWFKKTGDARFKKLADKYSEVAIQGWARADEIHAQMLRGIEADLESMAATAGRNEAKALNEAQERITRTRDQVSPNYEQVERGIRDFIGTSPDIPVELKKPAKDLVEAWISKQRAMLDAIGDVPSFYQQIRALISGDVPNPFAAELIRQRFQLENMLRTAGMDPDVITKIADKAVQEEIVRRFPSSTPEHIVKAKIAGETARLKKAGLPTKEAREQAERTVRESLPRSSQAQAVIDALAKTRMSPLASAVIGGTGEAVQFMKDLAFWMDANVFGGQLLVSIVEQPTASIAALTNRLLIRAGLPHFNLYDLTIHPDRRVMAAMDGVAQGQRTGATEVGGIMSKTGKVGEGIAVATDIQFGTILGGQRNLIHEGNLILARLAGLDITDPLVRADIARIANASSSFGGQAQRGGRAGLEKLARLTASMTRAQMNYVARMLDSVAPNATRSQRVMGSIAALQTVTGVLAIGAVMDMMFGDGSLVIDPTSNRFGWLRIPVAKNEKGEALNIKLFNQTQFANLLGKLSRAGFEQDPEAAKMAVAKWIVGGLPPGTGGVAAQAGYGYEPGGQLKMGDWGNDLSRRDRALAAIGAIPPLVSAIARGELETKTQAGLEIFGAPTYYESDREKERNYEAQKAFGKDYWSLDEVQRTDVDLTLAKQRGDQAEIDDLAAKRTARAEAKQREDTAVAVYRQMMGDASRVADSAEKMRLEADAGKYLREQATQVSQDLANQLRGIGGMNVPESDDPFWGTYFDLLRIGEQFGENIDGAEAARKDFLQQQSPEFKTRYSALRAWQYQQLPPELQRLEDDRDLLDKFWDSEDKQTMIREDPEVRAALERWGYESSSLKAVQARERYQAEQQSRDTDWTSGRISVDQWKAETDAAADKLSGELAQIFSGVSGDSDTGVPLLDDYYNYIASATTQGRVDWNKVDAWRAALSKEQQDELNQLLLDRLSPFLTPAQRELKEAQMKLAELGYYDVNQQVYEWWAKANQPKLLEKYPTVEAAEAAIRAGFIQQWIEAGVSREAALSMVDAFYAKWQNASGWSKESTAMRERWRQYLNARRPDLLQLAYKFDLVGGGLTERSTFFLR